MAPKASLPCPALLCASATECTGYPPNGFWAGCIHNVVDESYVCKGTSLVLFLGLCLFASVPDTRRMVAMPQPDGFSVLGSDTPGLERWCLSESEEWQFTAQAGDVGGARMRAKIQR